MLKKDIQNEETKIEIGDDGELKTPHMENLKGMFGNRKPSIKQKKNTPSSKKHNLSVASEKPLIEDEYPYQVSLKPK